MRIRRAITAAATAAVLGSAVALSPATAIINGTTAPEGAYPFMAAITDDTDFQYCGGSVISSLWVLTAAHCVEGIKPDREAVYVVTGRNNLTNTAQGQKIRVSQIVVQPNYDGSAYDAALLRLSSATSSTPITLATAANDNLEAAGTVLRVTGWGDQAPTLGLLSTNQLRQVDLRVVSDASCWTNLGFHAPTGVCAEEIAKDSCNGDSGGPLFHNASRIQVGIVSYGTSCAIPGFPGVYSEVNNPTIRSWIQSTAGV